MKIEQLPFFKIDVDGMVQFAKSDMYLVGHKERFADHLQRMEHFRGKEYTVKAAKKANQKLHKKVFVWEVL